MLNPRPIRQRTFLFATCASALILLPCQLLLATDRHWNGSSSTDWGTNGNWDTGKPSAGDNAVFNSSFTNQPNVATGSTQDLGGIWMATGVGQSVTISGSGTLKPGSSTINGTSGLGILVDNTSGFNLTITASLQPTAAETWRNNSGNTFTISGNVNTNSKAVTIDGTGDTSISGVISSTGSLTKSGSGALTLTGANTYSGGTTLTAGSLFVNNSSGSGSGTASVTVNGGTLGGSGTISGSVTVASGATLAPGALGTGGSTAILNTGALSLSSGANFAFDLVNSTPGTGYDQANVTGTVNLGGSNLVLNPGLGLSVGAKFYIIANDGSDAVSGTFSGLAQGASFTQGLYLFTISYTDDTGGSLLGGNDVSLTLIGITPEASTWISWIVAASAIAFYHRQALSGLFKGGKKWVGQKR